MGNVSALNLSVTALAFKNAKTFRRKAMQKSQQSEGKTVRLQKASSFDSRRPHVGGPSERHGGIPTGRKIGHD